jgi:hypothetical protein
MERAQNYAWMPKEDLMVGALAGLLEFVDRNHILHTLERFTTDVRGLGRYPRRALWSKSCSPSRKPSEKLLGNFFALLVVSRVLRYRW